MKLFDHIKETGVKIIRINDLFPIFLVKNIMNEYLFSITEYKITYGWGNGYIGLPWWHPYYKIDFNDIPIVCHGLLTFSQLDEDEDLWIIGFDTSHLGDNKDYCSKEYVTKQCKYIVKQCSEVKEAQRIIKLNKLNKLSNGRISRSI